MKMLKFLYYYLYSLFFCIRYLPLSQATKIPIFIHPSTKVKKMYRGGLVIDGKIWRSMIVIGFEGSLGRCNYKSIISVQNGCHVYFHGYTRLAKGCRLIVENGNVFLGNNVRFNGDCFISCYGEIRIGNDLMCGWNVSFLTTNGHTISIDGIEKDRTAPIVIGDHVWIGSDTVINKGVVIPNGCVCAHHSIVTKSPDETNCLIGGFPAKKLKSKVSWKP